ncbi:hypothetical protein [Candidatus Methylacidiphilum infernorum]|nr:hypothetical protein [Candidatus Methylacidiphilum infernorum]
MNHLLAIHQFLFGGVYPWAGELCKLTITQGDPFFAGEAAVRGRLPFSSAG